MGEFFKYFRKFLIKAGSQHNGVAAPLFLLLGLEFERFFSALGLSPSLSCLVNPDYNIKLRTPLGVRLGLGEQPFS